MKTKFQFYPSHQYSYQGRLCVGLESTEALCARVKHYNRLWDGTGKNQKLISRLCWINDKLLQRFKSGESLPRNVLQYLTGYKIVACVLLGRKYVI